MSKDNEIEHVEATAITPNALEQMERASIDIQIATAKAHPRSMEQFYRRAEAMVTVDKATAESCIYVRPVGKVDGKMVYAEGESIRLAEIAAATFGNIRIAGVITEITPRYVKAVGIAHDLESNSAFKAEAVEATVSKSGVPYSERMRLVTAKAAQSKAIRDAIFRVIPKSLVKPLVNKAKEVAKGDSKTFETRRKAVVDWIKTLKIAPERVWNAIGVSGKNDLSMEHLVLLAGLKTAIEDKDVTIDEAFPKLQTDPEGKSTVDRIKDHFDESSKKAGKPKGRGRAKKKDESPPPPPPEPKPEPEQEPEEPDTEPTAEEQAPDNNYRCVRCEREFPEANDGKCPYCMGQTEKL